MLASFQGLPRCFCHGIRYLRLITCRPPGKMFLMEIAQTFPSLAPALVKTQLELLALLEVALVQGLTLNVVVFFPTWVRGAVKRGFFKVSAGVGRGEQPLQLQQKRRKVKQG